MTLPEVRNRKALIDPDQPPKESRWPRTSRRQERVRAVLEQRQPDLTVVLENVHDPHNVSAILRTCDAVGVLRVHAIYSREQAPEEAYARQISASAAKWVEVDRYSSAEACLGPLRAAGFRILATAIGPEAVSLYDGDFTGKVALVMGNEMRGVSEEALALADRQLAIPMAGMVQSLNVSVATGVCLYEAFRQRLAAGAYTEPQLDAAQLADLEQEWLQR